MDKPKILLIFVSEFLAYVFRMGIFDLIILGFGEAMDAGAVSMVKGAATRKPCIRHYASVGLWFGGFQAVMTLVGYYFGARFISYVESFDHWISFILLTAIGLNMIKESIGKDSEHVDTSYSAKTMLFLAVATSIDALAVGISFAMLLSMKEIPLAVSFIAVITFILSAIGVKIGNVFGAKHKSKAELAGGIILILIGTKILLEHLGVINF